MRRGGQITNRVFRGKRDGSWKQIRGIMGSLSGQGISSMVMGVRFKDGISQSSGKE